MHWHWDSWKRMPGNWINEGYPVKTNYQSPMVLGVWGHYGSTRGGLSSMCFGWGNASSRRGHISRPGKPWSWIMVQQMYLFFLSLYKNIPSCSFLGWLHTMQQFVIVDKFTFFSGIVHVTYISIFGRESPWSRKQQFLTPGLPGKTHFNALWLLNVALGNQWKPPSLIGKSM